MPTVPVVDQTAVAPAQYAAPSVASVRNQAPEQIDALGKTLTQAGGTAIVAGQTIGDRVQAQVDDAKTKAAETSFLNTAQNLLYDPDKGYFRQLGKSAVDQYQPAKEAVVKAGQDALDGLDNGLQKQMFTQVMNQHLLSFGKQMADYNHSQSVAWSAGESKARSDSYQLLALGASGSRYQTDETGAPTGDFAKYTKQMEQEVLNTAALSGFDPDSAQAKAMLQEKYTALNHAMIAQLLDNHDAYGAKKWFDEQSAKGNIDLRDISALGNAVKSEYDRQQTIDLADHAISTALNPANSRDDYMVANSPKGLVEKGNLPIWTRPTIQNADGSHSSELSFSREDDGKEVLVPSIVNGKFMTPDGKMPPLGHEVTQADGTKKYVPTPEEKAMYDKAWDHYKATGEHLGKFDSPDDADAYAEVLHNRGAGSLPGAPVTLAMPVPGSSINVTSGLGQPRSDGRMHDGIDIAVPVGTQVLTPAAGKVVKVWNDDKFGGGLSVEMQLPNGMTAGFAHLSAANVREGDELQQGVQLGLSGKSGNATGPVLHYMMKDAAGNYVDPRQVSQPQPNKDGIAEPDALEKARQIIMNSDAAPEIKKGAIAQVQTQHSQYRAMQTQQYEDLKQKATDAFFASGGNYDAIPASIRVQLRPEDVHTFQKGIPNEDSVPAQEAFILHPENQTVAWVQAHQMDFSKGTYISYLTKVQNDANSPDKEKNASLDATQMDDILYKNGMANLVNPSKGSDDAKAAVALKTRIMDQFVSEQNSTKTPLTRDRKAQIIRQTVSDQVSVHGVLWDSSNKPVVGLTDSQAKNAYVTVGTQRVKLAAIPVQDQMQITAALRRTGQPVTQQTIAEYWVNAQNKRGKRVPTF